MWRRDWKQSNYYKGVFMLVYQGQRVLIISPHQDDEIIGCGGIIQKYLAAGSEIFILYVVKQQDTGRRYNKVCMEYRTYTGEERFNETMNAIKELHVKEENVQFLYAEKGVKDLDMMPITDIIDKLEAVVLNIKPDVIYFPSISDNQDHQKVNKAAKSVVRPHFYNGSVIEYEVANETDFIPNMYANLTKEEMENKIRALECYKSQIVNDKHKVSSEGILTKAVYRGFDSFSKYSEAFRVRRLIV